MGFFSSPAAPGLDSGWASATAGRPDNQDRCCCSPRWAVLSDGMGGYPGGGVAAELAVEAARAVLERARSPKASTVSKAVRQANAAVLAGRRRCPERSQMGATLTVAAAVDAQRWLVANAGDSPAWVVRAYETELVTEEHNFAAELFRRGALSAAEAASHPWRHVLSRGVGLGGEVVPAVRPVALSPGDRLVLASDGLAEVLTPSTLHELLSPVDCLPAAEQASYLVDLALARGATDNVTAVIVRRVAISPVAMNARSNDRPTRPRLAWR